ncbi:MAG: hypothetical protein ABR499_12855 [Gemmatimonadaceae bacterium]
MQTLDVVLGLIFLYLLLALACTAVNELIAQWLNMRATTLWQGLHSLLQVNAPGGAAPELLATLYSHPLIAGLSQPRRTALGKRINRSLPSYIPSRVFATALLDTIKPAGDTGPATLADFRTTVRQLPPELRRPLLLFIDDAGSDIERLRTSVGRWFEDSMQRVSGLYKRKTQVVTLATAFVITCVLNADSVRIWRVLSSNATLRETVVARAQALANTPPEVVRRQLAADSARRAAQTAATGVRQSGGAQPAAGAKPSAQGATRTADETPAARAADATRQPADTATAGTAGPQAQIRLLMEDVRSIGLPIGWNLSSRDSATLASSRFWKSPRDTTRRWTPAAYIGVYAPPIWRSLPGLLLTTLAVSLGAPFWFDLLNKVINIRARRAGPGGEAEVAGSSPASARAVSDRERQRAIESDRASREMRRRGILSWGGKRRKMVAWGPCIPPPRSPCPPRSRRFVSSRTRSCSTS